MIIDKITTECNFDYLDEHQEHKLKAVENTKFHKFLKGNVRKTVENCGSFLAFKVFQNIKNTDELRRTLSAANFCKHRFCIMCAWHKAKKLQIIHREWLSSQPLPLCVTLIMLIVFQWFVVLAESR